MKNIIKISDTNSKRRKRTLKDLNDRYSELIEDFNIKEAYERIVSEKPYKLLSCFQYDWGYAPLKRRELEELKDPVSPKLVKNKAAKKCYSAAGSFSTKPKLSTSAGSSKPRHPIVHDENNNYEGEFKHPSHR